MSLSDGVVVGFAALEHAFRLNPVQVLRSTCKIGTRRETAERLGFIVETFPQAYRPDDTLRGHFEFGLKYDLLNFEWLSRLFHRTESSWIEDWVRDTPNSLFARKTGFLYEWFTGKTLNVAPRITIGYESILPADRYFCATSVKRVPRWRIEDNLPGTPDWCPLVRLTDELVKVTNYDLKAEIDNLDAQFGAEMLMRSAAWLTFNESRASFVLEREGDRTSDIQRFAAAMREHCGRIDDPLSEESLGQMQVDILGPRRLREGIRQSPVFIGSAAHHDAMIVHYIAPPPEMLASLMAGLRHFSQTSRPLDSSTGPLASRLSLLRAAALSFGFVYIHPMADGNGRIHRMLINDTLLRDGLIPEGVIVPLSATIASRSSLRGDYEKCLNLLSLPFMRRYSRDYAFDREVAYPDGVVSDLRFDAAQDAEPVWRYPDLTEHSAYIARVILVTVKENMAQEALYLARHDAAKRRIKQTFEMPDLDADAIIRSIRENQGKVSNKLRASSRGKVFEDPKVAAEIVSAIKHAFDDELDQ